MTTVKDDGQLQGDSSEASAAIEAASANTYHDVFTHQNMEYK